MKKSVLICLALVLVITCLVLVGCSNTSNKQDPVETTKSDTIESNGGMAVKYGDYIYFINGYSGVSTLNTYGDVTLGALCRVTLKDGKPDYICRHNHLITLADTQQSQRHFSTSRLRVQAHTVRILHILRFIYANILGNNLLQLLCTRPGGNPTRENRLLNFFCLSLRHIRRRKRNIP